MSHNNEVTKVEKIKNISEEVKKVAEEEKSSSALLNWVRDKKEQTQTSGKSYGWLIGLIISLVVFVGLAIVAFQAWKKGREIAKLKHQIDVAEENKKKAELETALAESEEKQKKLQETATKITDNINNMKKEIAGLEKERLKKNEDIKRITSWEDVDKLLKG